MSKKKVLLIQGGLGAERDVSLVTGKGFAQALTELGYPFEILDAREDLPEELSKTNADVALLALHGKFAEDGVVQGICEYLKLPYTGSGVLSSSLCMDKVFTKQILVTHNILTPEFEVLDMKISTERLPKTLKPPFVVKPSREGSSVGITIVKSESEIKSAIELASRYDRFVLIEEYIDGMEVTVPILNEKPLTPIEIVPKVDFYSYENKYTAGKTEYHLPARVNEESIESLKTTALKIFHICRMRCYGRIDFRIDKSGRAYFLEVNSLPGCTPTSLLPKSASHDGVGFNQLIEILIENAGLDYDGVV